MRPVLRQHARNRKVALLRSHKSHYSQFSCYRPLSRYILSIVNASFRLSLGVFGCRPHIRVHASEFSRQAPPPFRIFDIVPSATSSRSLGMCKASSKVDAGRRHEDFASTTSSLSTTFEAVVSGMRLTATRMVMSSQDAGLADDRVIDAVPGPQSIRNSYSPCPSALQSPKLPAASRLILAAILGSPRAQVLDGNFADNSNHRSSSRASDLKSMGLEMQALQPACMTRSWSVTIACAVTAMTGM